MDATLFDPGSDDGTAAAVPDPLTAPSPAAAAHPQTTAGTRDRRHTSPP